MRADVLSDQGAYTRSLGLLCPSLTAAGLPGEFRIRYHRFHLVDRSVRMDIDHAYPFAPDLHLAPNHRSRSGRYRPRPASAPLTASALCICILDATGHR